MTDNELDQLALEVYIELDKTDDGYGSNSDYMIEFARRYRKALAVLEGDRACHQHTYLGRDIVERLRHQGIKHPQQLDHWREEAANEIDRLQRIIDSRSAINAGLPETYIQWSQGIMQAEIARAEKAENELAALRAMVFTNSDRNMTLKGRTFTVDDDGFICDQNFDFDAGMKVSGDFLDGERKQYAEMIAEALNKEASNAEFRPTHAASSREVAPGTEG